MKRFAFVAGLILILLVAAALMAGQRYYYPNAENPLFSVMLPDGWKVEAEDDVLHAAPADESIYLGFWAVDIESMDAVSEAVGSIVGELVSDFEVEEEGEIEINGMPMYYVDGAGVDDEGDDMECSLGVFSPDGETFCVILYFGTLEAENKHEEALNGILQSIKAH